MLLLIFIKKKKCWETDPVWAQTCHVPKIKQDGGREGGADLEDQKAGGQEPRQNLWRCEQRQLWTLPYKNIFQLSEIMI